MIPIPRACFLTLLGSLALPQASAFVIRSPAPMLQERRNWRCSSSLPATRLTSSYRPPTILSATAAASAPPATEKLPAGVLPITLTVFAQMIGEGIALTSLPLHMSRLGASTVATGVAVSAFSLASVIFTPVVVNLSSKFGRQKTLRACLLGCALAQLLIVRASAPAGVVLARAIAGIFAASVPVAQAAVTDLVTPAQSALALSRVSAVSQLGVVVGPAVGAAGIGLLTSMGVPDVGGRHMRCVFAASAAFAAAVLAAQYAFAGGADAPAPPAPPTPSPAEISPAGKRRNDALPLSSSVTALVETLPLATEVRSGVKSQWALRAVAVALGWGLTLSMATYCLFGSAVIGYDQSRLSINFSVAAAITVCTQLLVFPKMIRRLGEHLVCALGLTLSGAGLLSFSLARANPLHQIVYLASRVGNALGDTACATLVARASDGSEARARNLGAIYSVRAGARIVTPLLGAWLFELSRRSKAFPGALPYFICSALTAALIPVPLALKSFEDRRNKKAQQD
eukprot:CAMPEP_0194296442 /NCGR_PEP_ID=MMETSP0169-20130528/56120_1 /TAXON_ID=218684 /ORGANISM="Corethron pennatum, Strain L29A3" /LENGTH=513 /DNA_ID=CAMNT_0039045901 /DNA_START=105 /DNA_END=1646 /DNA_ORIENTATION=-